jgi:hypothetical protein
MELWNMRWDRTPAEFGPKEKQILEPQNGTVVPYMRNPFEIPPAISDITGSVVSVRVTNCGLRRTALPHLCCGDDNSYNSNAKQYDIRSVILSKLRQSDER